MIVLPAYFMKNISFCICEMSVFSVFNSYFVFYNNSTGSLVVMQKSNLLYMDIIVYNSYNNIMAYDCYNKKLRRNDYV